MGKNNILNDDEDDDPPIRKGSVGTQRITKIK